jgi:RNA polymerase sigma-70 factor (ECF subfamily)
MRAIAAGDRRVYRAMIDTYMADVQRFCASLLRDHGGAEDAAQETFIKLWTGAKKWKPTGALKSWLFKIAHNICIDAMRARKNHVDIDKIKTRVADGAPDARDAVIEAQNARIVRAALAALPARQRMAVSLVHYLDHSPAQAAKALNLSEDAFESLLRRGRAALKKQLGDQRDLLL